MDWDEKTATFKILALPPGDYLLTAQYWSGDGQNNRQMRAMRPIHAGTEDIRDIQLAPCEGPYLSGTVRLGGNASNVGEATQLAAGVTFDADNRISIYTRASGSFRQEILEPGEYSVSVPPQPGWNLQSVIQGCVDIRDCKITIGPEVDPDPIEIDLAQGGGTVEVLFPPTPALPDEPVKIVVLRQSSRSAEWLEQIPSVMVQTAANFTFLNIPAGDYTMFAWPSGTDIEYLNPEVIRKYAAFGQAVSVKDGGATRVTLKRVRIQ